jgi:RNA polymerase-binding transcription factor DksA
MDKSQKNQFERLLLQERQWLWSQCDATFDAKSFAESPPEPVPTEGHEDDIFEQLQLINFALRRISLGTYGTCVKCGREIPLSRLESRPEAYLCLDCQIAKEAASERASGSGKYAST